jgi:hypothetical protein
MLVFLDKNRRRQERFIGMLDRQNVGIPTESVRGTADAHGAQSVGARLFGQAEEAWLQLNFDRLDVAGVSTDPTVLWVVEKISNKKPI